MKLSSLKIFSPPFVLATTALAIGMLVTTTVNAMTLRELRQLERSNTKQGQWYVQYYLIGVLEGLQEANATTVRQGSPALFCHTSQKHV